MSEPGQDYIFLERENDIINWYGEILEPSVVYDIKIGGCVRICVGFQEGCENLYFLITETNVNGDINRFKGKGYDVYDPSHKEFIDKEFEFTSKNIIEVWWTETWEKSNPIAAAKQAEKYSNIICDFCNEKITTNIFHCFDCNDFDLCENCKDKEGNGHFNTHEIECVYELS